MAREIRNFPATIPAGTLSTNPQVVNFTMPARIARKVRVRVPPGCNGQVGFALSMAGVPIIPWNTGGWMVADNEVFEWDLEAFPDSGAWQLRGYNTGLYAHTLYVTFELDPPQVRRPAGGLVPIPAATLSPGVFYAPPSGGGFPGGEEPPGDDGIELEPPPGPEPLPPPPDEPGPVLPPPDAQDGYAIARVNALVAVQASLGATITTPPVLPPALGSAARIAYDAGRAAAISALELI